jgi:hypothetical protein
MEKIVYGKKFVRVVITLLCFGLLVLVGLSLFKLMSGFEIFLISIILMGFAIYIGKGYTEILYSNINHFHRIECEKKIKEFIDYSIRNDTLYRPFFRDLEVPIFDSDNKKYGHQPLYSYLNDKNKEFNNK